MVSKVFFSAIFFVLCTTSMVYSAPLANAAPEENAFSRTTTGSGPGTPGTTGSGVGTSGTTGSGVGTMSNTSLQNPLDASISSIPGFFLAILDILLVFAIPFVVFFIIYAGFLYVTARGNTSVIEQAHKALLYAIIGGLLIFGARAILDIITNTVNSVAPLPAEGVIQTN